MNIAAPASESLLDRPLALPCGATLSNRLCKSAMTEGLADARLRPTERHVQLYRAWSEGGAGLLISGNVHINRHDLERPGNVALDPPTPDAETRQRLKAWTAAGTSAGNQFWMQISHAGRQSPWYLTPEPLAPSAIKLKMLVNYRKPRAITENEILDTTQRFASVAKTAREVGFTGVQIHSAHGYLLSSFLSPITNRRTDAWGGSLENRARFLLETVKAVRAAVGDDFPVCIKLNSADFQKGGFDHADCLRVVEWLNPLKLDLLEISGGVYEQPRLLGYTGSAATATELPTQAESTRRREAYFLKYAADIRKVARMPLMVTGGFRSRAGMEAALTSGDTDMIGIARPLCTEPGALRRLLDGKLDALPCHEQRLRLGPGPFSQGTKITLFKRLNAFGQLAWYYQQLFRIADGRQPNYRMGPLKAFSRYLANEYATAWRLHRAAARDTAN